MKKHFLIYIIIIILFVSLTACTQEVTEADAVIKEAELTGFERNMAEMMTDKLFVYDIEINPKEAEELHLMIDYYERGEFKARAADMSGGISSGEKDAGASVRALFATQMSDEDHEKWITAVITNGGYSSSESESREVKDRENTTTGWGDVNLGNDLTAGESEILGIMIISEGDSISVRSNIDTKEDLKAATDYEQAYVLSVELN